MKIKFLFLTLLSFCSIHAMEQEIKEDKNDYLTVLQKEITREIIKQLIIGEESNIVHDNNSVYFKDGFRNKNRKRKEILQIRNVKSLGKQQINIFMV